MVCNVSSITRFQLKPSRGKFWKGVSKDNEMTAEEVDQIVVAPSSHQYIQSCGRSGSTSVTQGCFDIYNRDATICRVSWNCPWGSKANKFKADLGKDAGTLYHLEVGPWSADAGSIGTVELTIMPNVIP